MNQPVAYAVQVRGEDGADFPLFLYVADSDGEGYDITDCEHSVQPGEIFGESRTDYGPYPIFCGRCLITFGETTEFQVFATEEQAYAFYHANEPEWSK